MKAGNTKQQQQQHQKAERGHLLQASSSRHDEAVVAAPAPITKGCAAFLVVEDEEAQQRFAVAVALLRHPRMLELLGEAREEYGYAHAGAVAVPCSAERFLEAVDAANREHGARRHHHLFRLPHLAGCWPAHVVV